MMDWDTNPYGYLIGIVVAATFGAIAAGLKEVNGAPFCWKRLICRSSYRAALAVGGTLAAAPVTNDGRLILAAAVLLACIGIGEAQLLKVLPVPFKVAIDETKDSGPDH